MNKSEFPIKKEYHEKPFYISMYTAYKDENTMSSIHYHNGYELFFVTQGNMEFLINDKHYKLEKRSVLLIPPYMTHRSIYSKCEETYRAELIVLPTYLNDNISEKLEQFSAPTLLSFSPKQMEVIYSLIKRLYKELSNEEEYSNDLQILYFYELLIHIIRYGEVPERPNGNENIVQNAMKYINDNIQNKIYISDISKHLHINKRTLFSEFKKVSGLTITEYINLSRVLKAEHLLLNSQLSIYDIAFECGFNDSNYFSATFKKIKGFPPSQLLKKRKKT